MPSLLKDLYNDRFFDGLTNALEAVLPNFSKKQFLLLVLDAEWEQRELKQRMKHIAAVLQKQLSGNYPKDIKIILRIISQLRSKGIGQQTLEYMFLPEYIAMFGLEHFDASMKAVEFVTQFTSCEFAIRPFLLKYLQETMKHMQAWSKHESYYVRRFSSEGCRPRLPWGLSVPVLKQDPSPVLPILENLKSDPSEYVRRSVANNLNDIARDHPDVVMGIATRWKGLSKETDQVVKHGCRTLLKKANKETLSLWGLSHSPECVVRNFKLQASSIKVGDHLEFYFELINKADTRVKLRLEYAINYLKANGKLSRKLFRVTENFYEPKKVYKFSRRQSFSDMTTRKHYAGKHHIAIIVNGNELALKEFKVSKTKE